MYIVNANDIVIDKFRCIKILGEYLIYTKKIPVLYIDPHNNYYFAVTEDLRKALDKLPMLMRILALFQNQEGGYMTNKLMFDIDSAVIIDENPDSQFATARIDAFSQIFWLTPFTSN